MKFSVIVPLYLPYKQYIYDCIASIKNQSFKDFECILVLPKIQENDFKNLNIELDERFKIVESPYTEQSQNRNIGIKNCGGDYLIFVDCDDFLDLDYLQISNDILVNTKTDLIVYNFTRDVNGFKKIKEPSVSIYTDKKIVKNILFSYYTNEEKITSLNINTVWGKVFKRNIIENQILFDEKTRCGEDVLFVLDFGHYITSILLVENYISYCWRQNSSSLMSNIGPFFDLNNFFEHLDKIAEKEKINSINYIKSKFEIFNIRSNNLLNMYIRKAIKKKDFFNFVKNTYPKASYSNKTLVEYNKFGNKISKCILKENYLLLSILLSLYKVKNVLKIRK